MSTDRGAFAIAPKLRRPACEHDLVVLAADPTKLSSRGKPTKFETFANARAEDQLRELDLVRWASRAPGACVRGIAANESFSREEALALAARFAGRGLGQRIPTFASALFLRDLRWRLYGQLAARIAASAPQPVRLYTLVPESWRLSGLELPSLVPKHLLERLRAQLNRAGVADQDGWFIATVHGDYDPGRDEYQPHVHAIVVGEKVTAFEALRQVRGYQAGTVARPVVASPLKAPSVQVPYFALQIFWPSRVTPNGAASRSHTRNRIPEPRHAEWLMWMGRQRFWDLILLHGCEIVAGRLGPRAP